MVRLDERHQRQVGGHCIAGTPDEPRQWWRQMRDGSEEAYYGRNTAENNRPDPSRAFNCTIEWRDPVEHCLNCPAYRSERRGYNGMSPVTGQPLSFTPEEHDRWWDDAEEYFEWKAERHFALATLIRWRRDELWEYPEAIAERNRLAREWRAAHPGADKRNRAAYRREQRRKVVPVRTQPSRESGGSDDDERAAGVAPARARVRSSREQEGGHDG